jgi:hypothetical protein
MIADNVAGDHRRNVVLHRRCGGATNEWFGETKDPSVPVHCFNAVCLRRTLNAEPRASRSEYCSGSWSLGGWSWLESRLLHSCQGWLQRLSIVPRSGQSPRNHVSAAQTLHRTVIEVPKPLPRIEALLHRHANSRLASPNGDHS